MKILNKVMVLCMALLFSSGIYAVQDKSASNPPNKIEFNYHTQQGVTQPFMLAKDQLCRLDRESGVVHCQTQS